jgi:biopolymer transport protein ExbD
MNFTKNSGGLEKPGFQLAPMVDVVFLLLCFFITSQLYAQWEEEVDVSLPSASTGETPKRLPGEVIVNVRMNGVVVVNGRILDDAGLESMLQRLSKITRKGQPILIRADKEADFQHIVRVLDYCRKADIWNISFATGQPPKEPQQ